MRANRKNPLNSIIHHSIQIHSYLLTFINKIITTQHYAHISITKKRQHHSTRKSQQKEEVETEALHDCTIYSNDSP